MNRCLSDLVKRFDDARVHYRVEQHPYAVTAQEVADLEHVPGHAFAKSVVVQIGGNYVLLVLQAPHVVDLGALEDALLADEARLATEEEFAPLFLDCEVGTMPPFGRPGIELYLDKGLIGRPEIVFEAGSHHEAVRMRTEDYVWLAQPKVLSFAREPIQPEPRNKDADS
jgi:Ala-tRNA(Pro) deacylase